MLPKLDLQGDCLIATVNGGPLNPDNVAGFHYNSSLIIKASHGQSSIKTIELEITSPDEGTYPISDEPNAAIKAAFVRAFTSDYAIYTAKSGSLTIETNDTVEQRIIGTFYFEGEANLDRSASITDGFLR